MSDNIPIYTHTYVLGADIGVDQRACHTHDYRGRTRETAVSVEPYVGKRHQQPCRTYLAAWARRTIERPNVLPTKDGDDDDE